MRRLEKLLPRLVLWGGAIATLVWGSVGGSSARGDGTPRPVAAVRLRVVEGTVTFDFAPDVLSQLEIELVSRGDEEDRDSSGPRITFAVDSSSHFSVERFNDGSVLFAEGRLFTCGAILIHRPGYQSVIGNLAIEVDGTGAIQVVTTLNGQSEPDPVFTMSSVLTEHDRAKRSVRAIGELALAESWASEMGLTTTQETIVGRLVIDADVVPGTPIDGTLRSCGAADIAAANALGESATPGPDVIVADLQSTIRFDRVGDITSYGVGTTSCNIGTARANWVSYSNQHPVILMNLHRLDADGFQQIGMSWVKHGFYAVSQSLCGVCNDPTDGTQLGVGCSDPYSAPLNGVQSNMSPRSTVNAHTGYFPYPWGGPPAHDKIERRVQVHDADLDPALNANARYFIEGHYLLADDAVAGNADNNASYREVRVSHPTTEVYNLVVDSSLPTRRGRPAVRAWKDVDPAVVESEIRVPGEGLFLLAAKVAPTGTGMWRYIYALQNLNSDRSAQSFRVPLPLDGIVGNIGFHDVDHHSGEPYDTTDWSVEVSAEAITWSTVPYSMTPYAHALRFGVIFSFSFEANVPPESTTVVIGLFKPGSPAETAGVTIGPQLQLIDCNRNGIADACDVRCDEVECVEPCGTSTDCNDNGVPDECESDCNNNDVADACDLRDCPAGDRSCADCDHNLVPDACDPDCDRDGIPDACDVETDTDGDGVTDCFDLCPTTTPPGACVCPPLGLCCFQPGFCIPNYPRLACLDQGGTPDCLQAPCYQGCLLGDTDDDGNMDLRDFFVLQSCYSGVSSDPDFVMPTEECLIPLDFNEDGDIDAADYTMFRSHMNGP